MRKLVLALVVCAGALAPGCDGTKTKSTETVQYPATVTKPATVTEKHTVERKVDVENDKDVVR